MGYSNTSRSGALGVVALATGRVSPEIEVTLFRRTGELKVNQSDADH